MEENEFEKLPQIECSIATNDYATLEPTITNLKHLDCRIVNGTVYHIGRIGDLCAAVSEGNWYLSRSPGTMRVSNASPHDFATAYIEHIKHQAVFNANALDVQPMPDTYGDW